MKIKFSFSALRETRWQQAALRFLTGGLITVATGLIAKKFGAEIGGLFLAFPAIFPAGATLIERREVEEKQRLGLPGTRRARLAVGADAAGAGMGAFGLLAFAWTVATQLPRHSAWLVLLMATAAWAAVSFAMWKWRKLA